MKEQNTQQNTQRIKVRDNFHLQGTLQRASSLFVERTKEIRKAFALVGITPNESEVKQCALNPDNVRAVVEIYDYKANGKPTTPRTQRMSDADISEQTRIILRNLGHNYATPQGARFSKWNGNEYETDTKAIQEACEVFIEGEEAMQAWERHQQAAKALNEFFNGAIESEHELTKYFAVRNGMIVPDLELCAMTYPPTK